MTKFQNCQILPIKTIKIASDNFHKLLVTERAPVAAVKEFITSGPGVRQLFHLQQARGRRISVRCPAREVLPQRDEEVGPGSVA